MKFRKPFFLKLIVIITFFGCVDSGKVLKPANLISENQMEQILYDATLMEVMSTFSKKNSAFEAILGKSYLYKKYSIDSLQLIESENYYAKKPRIFHRIHSAVLKKMDKVKDSLDLLAKNKK